jgi:hypothetical protein
MENFKYLWLDLMMRWFAVRETCVVESNDP